jgi:hypothetical protein
MTREEALAHCAERNAEDRQGHWTVQELVPGDWRAVRLLAPGLKPVTPEGTRTEKRPRPDYADDPRPAQFRNVPPFGGGV